MNHRFKKVLLAASLLSLSVPQLAVPAEAAGKNIRVALFIDTGQGYRGTVPDVTLSSDQGLSIRAGDKNDLLPLPTVNTDTARFAVDEYHFLVLETPDAAKAQQVARQLGQRKVDASILLEMRSGSTIYQVVSGSYASPQAAALQAAAIAQVAGYQPELSGPFHLEAGTFTSQKEAQDWEKAFEMSGISADTVMIPQGSKWKYAVWIGAETSNTALPSLEKKAKAAFSNFAYEETSADSAYVLVKKEMLQEGGKETVPRYLFSPKTKLTISGQKGSGIPLVEVEEREQRKYRGVIELSSYKNHLTVINELPLEQYLYGVVGSEMIAGWPLEALKTQAVLSRTRAVNQGNKYGVANLSDTVLEQAYYGYTREAADVRKAVDQTAGEVITYKGKPIEPYFYSNAGGLTSDGTEVWGNSVPYLKPVESDDEAPMIAANIWYMASLPDGTIGYVRSDFVRFTGPVNPLALRTAVTTQDNLNFRAGPSAAYHKVVSVLPQGTEVTVIRQEPEENAFSWTRGPYTPAEITAMINASQDRNKAARFTSPIETLRVTDRGPSGRVLKMEADGKVLATPSPDGHRSIFKQGDSMLRSTKFDVEEMGTFTVLGANGERSQFPATGFDLQVIGADETGPVSANGYSGQFAIFQGGNRLRITSKEQQFLLRGNGFGHGLGVSQFGAKAMAEKGYDYQEILQHYYTGVKIER